MSQEFDRMQDELDYTNEASANRMGFHKLSSLDDELKMKIVAELYNRFDSSWALEAHLSKKEKCCGKKDKGSRIY